jgi:PilZ domain
MEASAKIRKHLTPPTGLRRATELRREIRREVSERVTLKGRDSSLDGWSLNVSRGGVRVIVEREVPLGELFDVTIGVADASPLARQGRVVWFQEEADGFIVGIAFVGSQSAERPAVSA